MEQKETFQYTYSAQQQEEIRAIRKKYTQPEQDKMALLRRLDESVTQKATMAALIVGVLGTLIMGSGMSLILSDLHQILDFSQTLALVLGLALGVCGGVMAALAYPVYRRVSKGQRKKVTPQILQLTEELLQ